MALQYPMIPATLDCPSTQAPAPVTGLTGGDLQRLRRSLDSSVSDNTRAMYNSAWRSFESWGQARGALSLPASPPLVAAYLAYLAEARRLSVATIRLHKAALAAVHKAAGHEDPTDNEGVRRIMRGMARAHGKGQKQARPLTAKALAAVKATAMGRRQLGDGKRQESAARASWRGRVDVALLATLRDGSLKRSEAAALTWGDVEFRDNGSSLLHLRRSKTDQEAEGVVLYIGTEARRGAAGSRHPGLRDDHTSYWQPGQGRGKGCRPGRGLHWPQRPRGHGPGPGEKRRGTASFDDRRTVEELQDAGALHGTPGGGPGSGGQVLPGERGLELTPDHISHTQKKASSGAISSRGNNGATPHTEANTTKYLFSRTSRKFTARHRCDWVDKSLISIKARTGSLTRCALGANGREGAARGARPASG